MVEIIKQAERKWLIKGKGQLPQRWSAFALPAMRKFLGPFERVSTPHFGEPTP
jgi:hypothetical protein